MIHSFMAANGLHLRLPCQCGADLTTKVTAYKRTPRPPKIVRTTVPRASLLIRAAFVPFDSELFE